MTTPSLNQRTRIKICGLTREADVDAAVDAGADAIGLVLYEGSPRHVSLARAIELAQPRDVVLIAGKGHENYQEFADHTVPFDDMQVARRAVENHPMDFSL